MYHGSLSYHDDDDDGTCEFDSVCSESVMSMGSRLTDVTAECHLHVVPHTTLFTAIILLLLHHDGDDDDRWSHSCLDRCILHAIKLGQGRVKITQPFCFGCSLQSKVFQNTAYQPGQSRIMWHCCQRSEVLQTLLIIMGRVKIKRCCCRRSEV